MLYQVWNMGQKGEKSLGDEKINLWPRGINDSRPHKEAVRRLLYKRYPTSISVIVYLSFLVVFVHAATGLGIPLPLPFFFQPSFRVHLYLALLHGIYGCSMLTDHPASECFQPFTQPKCLVPDVD